MVNKSFAVLWISLCVLTLAVDKSAHSSTFGAELGVSGGMQLAKVNGQESQWGSTFQFHSLIGFRMGSTLIGGLFHFEPRAETINSLFREFIVGGGIQYGYPWFVRGGVGYADNLLSNGLALVSSAGYFLDRTFGVSILFIYKFGHVQKPAYIGPSFLVRF